MKSKILITVFIITVVAFVVYSVNKNDRFAPSEDFPREALIYVQISDLPTFIKLWNESKFKEKYTASQNFGDFKNRHLGLKLASRWEEFSIAAGFPIDLETVASLANKQAAIAVYDIGKLEFVFIAPVSDEVFAATRFVQNQDKFSEETLADGTKIYRAKVEADRGRQKQELIFTNAKGRFILATNEKLLAQTLNNINGNQAKNRLIDEPLFKDLSEKTEPHLATVWVNQVRLNDDYYFKRYWLMSNAADLKNIRAGIFDFEIQEEKLIERRKFLLDENVSFSPILSSQAEKVLAFLPENIPFYQLRKANQKTIDSAIWKTIFDRRQESEKSSNYRSGYYSADTYDYSSNDYSSLSKQFDENIDEIDEKEKIENRQTNTDFSEYVQSANPQAVLTFTEPEILPAPKFVEFRRAAIFHLAAPTSFNQTAFESAIEQSISAQILISSPNVRLLWKTKNANDSTWRELNLPMLGWSLNYIVRENELILTNNSDFLQKILTAKNSSSAEKPEMPLSELMVINLAQKENAYDKVFVEIAEKKVANNFFTGNVGSLLDSVSEIKRIEIRRSYSQNLLSEELTASFNK